MTREPEPAPPEPRSDQVPIRLPSGEQAWVSAGAFNLISEKEFRHSERLRRLKAQRNAAAAAAAVALIGLVAGAVSLLAGRDLPSAPAAEIRPDEQVTVRPPAAEAAPGSSGPASAPEDREIEGAVRAWARAWADRDADAVLAFYSPRVLVPDGMSRDTWERLRRERVESPELLALAIDELAVERTGPTSARARFRQVVDTPGYRARVLKTLELANESGRWLIVDELASLAEVGAGAAAGGESEPVRPAPE